MPLPSPTQPRRGIRYTDRVFVAGINGGGKSVVINHVATGFRCQEFLYDTKDEFSVPGVAPVRRIADIDWSLPLIHYIDDEGDLKETNRLFRVLWQRKVGRDPSKRYGLIVICHEVADLCGDQPGATPPAVSNYVRKGRAHGLGMISGGQRPRNIPRICRTEAQQVISMCAGFDPEDVPVMAGMHNLTVPEYERALAQARELGEHAYLWFDKRTRTNVIRPPLPPERLKFTIAEGIDPRRHLREPEPEPDSRRFVEFPESEPAHSGSSPGNTPDRGIL